MISDKQKSKTYWAIDTAKSLGTKDARVSFVSATSNSFEYRDKQIDQLKQSTENKLYIELFINDGYSSFSTNRTKKMKSLTCSILLDNSLVARLLAPILSAISGASIQQKNSILLVDRLKEKIVPSKLSLIDQLHINKTLGTRLYDGEDVATRKNDTIRKGVLENYHTNTYYSHKLNMPSGPCLEGEQTPISELMQSIVKGIWVANFNRENPNTSDFLFGIEGFYIGNGEVKQAISKMNITENLLGIWNKLEDMADDTRANFRWRMPSILFNDIGFSGLL